LLVILPLAAGYACSDAGLDGTTSNVPLFPENNAAVASIAAGAGGGSAAPAAGGNSGAGEAGRVNDFAPPAAGGGGGTGSGAQQAGAGGASAANGGAGQGGRASSLPGGVASAGCGRSTGIPASAGVANAIVTFPPAYDGSTPLPLVFAFHGAGRTNLDMQTVDSRTVGSELESNYVMAFLKSAGNGWDIGADYPRFEAALQQLLSERCIDTEHLFAFGHSSGAQFIAQMLGDNRTRETRFAAVVPVASTRFNNPDWEPLPTLVIHGLNDTQRGGDTSGALDLIQYTQSNECTGGTQPRNVPSCNSLDGGVAVNAGCVAYAGCAAATVFCNHDDPNYAGTNHGWPCFANSQIFEFFESVL
jgi:predicted esterase